MNRERKIGPPFPLEVKDVWKKVDENRKDNAALIDELAIRGRWDERQTWRRNGKNGNGAAKWDDPED